MSDVLTIVKAPPSGQHAVVLTIPENEGDLELLSVHFQYTSVGGGAPVMQLAASMDGKNTMLIVAQNGQGVSTRTFTFHQGAAVPFGLLPASAAEAEVLSIGRNLMRAPAAIAVSATGDDVADVMTEVMFVFRRHRSV